MTIQVYRQSKVSSSSVPGYINLISLNNLVGSIAFKFWSHLPAISLHTAQILSQCFFPLQLFTESLANLTKWFKLKTKYDKNLIKGRQFLTGSIQCGAPFLLIAAALIGETATRFSALLVTGTFGPGFIAAPSDSYYTRRPRNY